MVSHTCCQSLMCHHELIHLKEFQATD